MPTNDNPNQKHQTSQPPSTPTEPARTCTLCDAPTTPATRIVTTFSGRHRHPVDAHRACFHASFDSPAELARLRKTACESGHHRYPGTWSADPDDPYGDAKFWECAKSCGHVQRHPGYGTGRAIAELETSDASR